MFDLENEISTSLKSILEVSLEKNLIDPKTLRMILVRFNTTFDHLMIYATEEWEEYYYHCEEKSLFIGSINISSWLEVGDSFLFLSEEKQREALSELPPSQLHWGTEAAALPFSHLPKKTIRPFFEHLRDSLLVQIINASREVAVALQGIFQHTVGIVGHQLQYEADQHIEVLAFCHKYGEGPFYKVRQTLPQFRLTYPYLKFSPTGFVFFYPNGDRNSDNNTESSAIYEHDFIDIKQIDFHRRGIDFLLKGEVETWGLCGGHTNENFGDFSKDQFLCEFKRCSEAHSHLKPKWAAIPHPIKSEFLFKEWLHERIESDLKFSKEQIDELNQFNREAKEHILQQLPQNFQSRDMFLKTWSAEEIKAKEYAFALSLLENLQETSLHLRQHKSELQFILGRYGEIQKTFASLQEPKTPEQTLEFQQQKNGIEPLLGLIELLQENPSPENLAPCLKFCYERVELFPNAPSTLLSHLFLAKYFHWQREQEKAFASFIQIPFTEDLISEMAKSVFISAPSFMEFLQNQIEAKSIESALDQQMNDLALPTPVPLEDAPLETPSYSFYFKEDLETNCEDVSWFHALDPQTFLVQQDTHLFAQQFDSQHHPTTLDSCEHQLPKNAHPFVLKRLVFLPQKNGVQLLSFEKTFKQEVLFYSADPLRNYQQVIANDTHIFAVNHLYLEIFPRQVKPGVNQALNNKLYIGESCYGLNLHENLLVINGRNHLLIDVSNPANPEILSALSGLYNGGTGFLKFYKHLLIGDKIVDITDPKNPQYLGNTPGKPVPLFDFRSTPENHTFATEHTPCLVQINETNAEITLSRSLPVFHKNEDQDKRMTSSFGIVLTDHKLFNISHYNYTTCQLQQRDPKEQLQCDLTEHSLFLLENSLQIIQKTPSFKISKIVFHKSEYSLDLAIHAESSLCFLTDPYQSENALPILRSSLSFYRYFEQVLNQELNLEIHQTIVDFESLKKSLWQNEHFSTNRSAQFTWIVNNQAEIYTHPNSWNPYRHSNAEKPQSTLEILANNQPHLLSTLDLHNPDTLQEIVCCLNEADKAPGTSQGSTFTQNYHQRFFPTISSSAFLKYDFYQQPQMNLETPSLPPSALRENALAQIIQFENQELRNTILLNFAKYSLGSTEAELTAPLKPNLAFLKSITQGRNGLKGTLGKTAPFQTFLQEVMHLLPLDLKFQFELMQQNFQSSHLTEYFFECIRKPDFNFRYYANHTALYTLCHLPDPFFEKHKQEIQAHTVAFLNQNKDDFSRVSESQLAGFLILQMRAGIFEFPTQARGLLENVKKQCEQFPGFFDEDEESALQILNQNPKSLSALVNKIRSADLTLLFNARFEEIFHFLKHLKNDAPSENLPLLPFSPEPFSHSWETLFHQLFFTGNLEWGDQFTKILFNYLIGKLNSEPLLEIEQHFFKHFFNYGFKTAYQHPLLATQLKPLVHAFEENRSKFLEQIDLRSLREKTNLLLLQDAWNDLSEGRLDTASQKCETLLQVDEKYPQIYFLKARLLWLQEGVDAYLAREKEFLNASSHDAAGLSRIYNMSGVAYDEKGMFEKALPYFEKAAKINPAETMYLPNLAEIHYKLKNSKMALHFATEAQHKGVKSEMIQEILSNQGVRKTP